MNEWISIKDRWPEEGTLVLTVDAQFTEWNEYRLDYWTQMDDEKMWNHRLEQEMDDVTHWMPLPKPPKIDE